MCAEIYVLTVPSHEGTLVALSCGKKLRVYLVATDVPNRRTRAYTIPSGMECPNRRLTTHTFQHVLDFDHLTWVAAVSSTKGSGSCPTKE